MRDHGVLACTIGHAFELAPPLIVTRAELDRTVEVASRAIREIATERGLA
jgi:adenosylmethionine-8-amino-7-oxononanoate aminotransferase